MSQSSNVGSTPRRTRRRAFLASVVVFLSWAVLAAAVPSMAAAQTGPARERAALLAELEAVLADLTSSAPAPARAVQSLICSGDELHDQGEAKGSYETNCGQDYDPNSGRHKCDWVTVGWVCSGPKSGGDGGADEGSGVSEEPENPDGSDPGPDPTVGGPNGDGPLLPTNVRAVPVTGNTEGINPEGIRVSWEAGGGPESIGFNITRDDEYLTSIVGRSWFIDCDVVANRTYEYSVSAWAEGEGNFSFRTLPTEATAGVTPSQCKPLTPPGPGGPDGPFEDPIFDLPRNKSAKPPQPQQVKIVDNRLQWEMVAGPRYMFQITRNGLTEPEGDLWGQFAVTSGHPDLDYARQSDGRVRFSIPVSDFSAGDRFVIQAVHPYAISDVPNDARFSPSSRFATIFRTGTGTTIQPFLNTFGTNHLPRGSWIGSKDDWKTTPQFSDNFDGSGKLADQTNKWYFARNDGPTELTPSNDRDKTQTDKRAVLDNGKLVMSAGRSDGQYSYIGTANDQGEGYKIDPANGVFVEASVRLDQMSPADNAWWAFWLMAPGSSPCDGNGEPTKGGSNAYDGHAETGTEVDIFEFVPDLGNGFNQAMFRHHSSSGCPSPGKAKISLENRNFAYEGHLPFPGVTMPKYMDGNYHRLGLYYAQDCYAFYMDDQLLWQVTDPDWQTPRAKESIRLTWEVQNPKAPWTDMAGSFGTTARDSDPTVFIDFVNVWEKKESANGLCSGEPDPDLGPEPQPDPELERPVNVAAMPENGTIRLNWTAGEGLAPDGYDIRRDNAGHWSVSGETEFIDYDVDAGQTYKYEIVPWTAGPDGKAGTYGPESEAVTVTADENSDPSVNGMAAPKPAVATRDGGAIWVKWTPGAGLTPDGYDIRRNNEAYWTVVDEIRFLDTSIIDGQLYTYVVTPWVETDGDPNNRKYGTASAETSATGGSGPIPDLEPPHDPDPNAGPNYRQIFRDDFDGNSVSDDFAVPSWTAPNRATRNSASSCSQKNGKLHLAIEQVGDEQLACYLISKAGNYGPGIDSTVKIEYRANVSQVLARGAWFAGWVYPLGDTSGQPNAADGVLRTGSEYDVFEYMPTRPAEFQNAVHDSEAIKMEKWTDPRDFGIDLARNEFHTFGLEWNKDCVAFFIDGIKVSTQNSQISAAKKHSIMLSMEAQTGMQWQTWDVGDFATNLAANPAEGVIDWVEVQKKKSLDPELCSGGEPETEKPGQVIDVAGEVRTNDIKLTWSPATSGPTPDGFEIRRNGEVHATIAATLNPESAANAAASDPCSGSRPMPGADPTDAQALYSQECGMDYDPMSGFHKCDWVTGGWVCTGPRGDTAPPTGTVPTEFIDDDVVDGQTYEYSIVPWINPGAKIFGPVSAAVTVTAGTTEPPGPETPGGPGVVQGLRYNITPEGVLRLEWDEPDEDVDGYLIFKDQGPNVHDHKSFDELIQRTSVSYDDWNRGDYLQWSDFVPDGGTAPHVYEVQPFRERADRSRILGIKTAIYTTPEITGRTGATPPVSSFRLDTLGFDAEEHGGLRFSFEPPSGVEPDGYRFTENGTEWGGLGLLSTLLEVVVAEEGEGPDRLSFTVPESAREGFFAQLPPAKGRLDFAIQAFVWNDNVVTADGLRGKNLSDPRIISASIAANGFVEIFDRPLLAPVQDLMAVQTRFKPEIGVSWIPQEFTSLDGLDIEPPSGYNIERNGKPIASVSSSPFYDEDLTVGSSNWYRVVPFYRSSGGEVEFGPEAATPSVTVIGLPSVISPDAPRGLTATQTNSIGTQVELTWLAPEGWEQGLITGYQVMRNGVPYGERVPEPTFTSDQLPYATRRFVDNQALPYTPISYSVVAYSTSGPASEGARSDVVLIEPGAVPPDAPLPVWGDIPNEYVVAAEVVFRVSGHEARRLGAEFYTLHDYIKNEREDDHFKSLLRSFNQSARARNVDGALNNPEARSASLADGKKLLTAIATKSGGPDGHLLAIIPELFMPAGYGLLVYLGGWRAPKGLTEDQQLEQIKLELDNLQEGLGYNEARPQGRTGWELTRNASQLIIWNTFNVKNIRADRPHHSHDRWYTAVRTGTVPPCVFCVQYPDSVAMRLFREATEQDRVDFYGIDQDAWIFVQPYIDLALHAQKNVSDIRRATINGYISIAITLVAAAVTAGASATWTTLAIKSFAAYAANYIVTGSTAQAEKAALGAAISVGVDIAADGIAADLAAGNAVSGLDIATFGLLKAADAYLSAGGDPEKAARNAFIGAIGDHYGPGVFGEEAWEILEPAVAIVEDVVWSAILGDGIDWDDVALKLKNLVIDVAADKLGDLVNANLPKKWGDFRAPLSELASYAVVAGGNEAKIRQYFYNNTLPKLAELVGSAVTDRLGKEKFFSQIAGELVAIGLTYGSPAYDELAFQKLIYGIVGDFVQGEIKDGLESLNSGGDATVSWMIDSLAELAYIGIAYEYDPQTRQSKINEFKTTKLAEVLLILMPGCVDKDDPAITGAAQGIAEAALGKDLDPENVGELILDGFWAGKSIADSCGGPGEEEPPSEASLRGFYDALLGLQASEINMVDAPGGDELMLEDFPNLKVKIVSEPELLVGADARIFARDGETAPWVETTYLLRAEYDDNQTVDDFTEVRTGCPTNVAVQGIVGGSTAGGRANLATTTTTRASMAGRLFAAAAQRQNCADTFIQWLTDLDGAAEIEAELPFTSVQMPSGHVVEQGRSADFPDFFVEIFDEHRADIYLIVNVGGSAGRSPAGSVGVLRDGSGAINGFYRGPDDGENLKEWITGLSGTEINDYLEFSEVTLGGEGFTVVSSPLVDGQRLRLSGQGAGTEIGTVEQQSVFGDNWNPRADLVTVTRSGSSIDGFEHLDDTRLENMAGPMGRLLLSLVPGIPTSSEDWNLLWNQAVGCGAAVGKALADLWVAVTNPIDTIVALLKAIPELIVLFAYSPSIFGEELLIDLLKADEYAKMQELEPGSLAEARWMGELKCDIVISLAGGAALKIVSRAATANLVDRVNNGDHKRFIPDCQSNSFPAGTLVLMGDGAHTPIESIRPGDYVISHNLDTGVWEPKLVLDQWSHPDRGPPATATLVDGSTITATDDHLFWVENTDEWTELRHVQPGDEFLTPVGTVVVDHSTTEPAHPWTVWELAVADNHNFTVAADHHDLLVHNAGPELCGKDKLSDEFRKDLTEQEIELVETWQAARRQLLDDLEENFDSLPDTLKRESGPIDRARNAITNGMTPDDVSGILKESRGVEILKPNGTPYDHINEGIESLQSVENALGALNDPRLLNDPSLTGDQRRAIAETRETLEQVRADYDLATTMP